MTNRTDLQDLVDNPSETLSIELKEWLNISENSVRATLARHIAAIANYGGGYLVIGFDDECKEVTPDSENVGSYTRDAINGIVDKYLIPSFHCEVSLVATSDTNIEHPIIWVPSHQAIPICSRADGPQDSKGRPQGIRIGTYYIRAPGPKSEPITTPDTWTTLIRRCVVNERDSLLSDIYTVLSGRDTIPEKQTDLCAKWHAGSHVRFETVLGESQDFDWPVDYGKNYYQMSYRILKDSTEQLEASQLIPVLEEANRKVRELVWTGWSMFYPFSPEDIRPYFYPDITDGTESDVLETNLINAEVLTTTLPDFWRFSCNGYASLIRAYREDRHILRDSKTNLLPGTWISPYTLIREVSEFVRHALVISKMFDSSTSVEINISWVGLANRRIDEFDPGVDWKPRTSRADSRNVQGQWPISELVANWEEIVATLATPVCRLFNGLEVTENWVRKDSQKYREL